MVGLVVARRCLLGRSRCPAQRLLLMPLPRVHTSYRSRSLASDAKPEATPLQDNTDTDISARQLRKLFICAAIPMVGFGMMDNFIMIQAGDLIDQTIGVRFGLASLTAAAMGQIVSDTSGVAFGGVVDAAVAKLGLQPPRLTPAQLTTRVARFTSVFGGIVGVFIGCSLGMTSLLFLDLHAAEREKKAREIDHILQKLVGECSELNGTERTSMFMWDKKEGELWSKVATGMKGVISVPDHDGLVGKCLQEGRLINVADAQKHKDFDSSNDKASGFHTRQVLCCPVRGADQTVYGVLQFINKKNSLQPFDSVDEKMAMLTAGHLSAFLTVLGYEADAATDHVNILNINFDE